MICWVHGVIQVVGVGGVVDTLIRDFVEEGPQSVHQPLIQSSMETNCFHLETVQIVLQTPKQISNPTGFTRSSKPEKIKILFIYFIFNRLIKIKITIKLKSVKTIQTLID
jgi:hypothetical protein